MVKKVAHVVVPLPVDGPFDYEIPEHMRGALTAGMRVLVPFAGQKCVGCVVGLAQRSTFSKLSLIAKVLDEAPVFSPAFLKWAEHFAAQFACSAGEALELFLPVYLRKPRLFERHGARPDGEAFSPEKERPETSARQLIFDVGGTKRWEVLRPRIEDVLAQGRGVLCLIPDGSFGPEILSVLSRLVAPEQFVVIHKGTEKEEYERWRKIHGGRARLVVGCLSAVFAPVNNLGLTVIFEEENSFYKHDQSPFYHAREAAFLRQRFDGGQVICVSSAPSVEVWHALAEKREQLLRMDDALAPVKLLDLTNFKMRRETAIAPGLAQHIERVLQEKKKALLYVPAARGTADVTRELSQRFPGARVASYEKTTAVLPQGYDVLVATQSVFRHRASLRFSVGAVVDIDWEFHKNDYRAAHGAFALVQHMRQMTTGFVLLQTRNIHNEYLHFFAANDYEAFYRRELHQRRDMGLPPYNVLAAVVVRSADPELACAQAKRLYDVFNEKRHETIGVMEPQQDRSAIVRGKFRYCVMVHGLEVEELVVFIKESLRSFPRKKDIVVTVNVNP